MAETQKTQETGIEHLQSRESQAGWQKVDVYHFPELQDTFSKPQVPSKLISSPTQNEKQFYKKPASSLMYCEWHVLPVTKAGQLPPWTSLCHYF